MREAVAELWALHAAGAVVAVTTSGAVGRDGRAQVGRGLARQAAERHPWFAPRLGALLSAHGVRVELVGERIVAFPVERDPWQTPEPRLIARSAEELVALADVQGWGEVVLPRPGCGFGGLGWGEVGPLLVPRLDDRFLVVRWPGP